MTNRLSLKKRLAAGVGAAALAAWLVAMAVPAAQADSGIYYCGTLGWGVTGQYKNPNSTGPSGTRNLPAAWTFRSLRLEYGFGDDVGGYYRGTAAGRYGWHLGAVGYVFSAPYPGDLVLVSDVVTGTPLTLCQLHSFGYTAAVNY
jgi:hypothetical protein